MLDRAALERAVARHGAVVRVVICAHQGSSPREAGAAMLVWDDADAPATEPDSETDSATDSATDSEMKGQSGTIGGGTLEHEATRHAREILAGRAAPGIVRQALGPNLGQCCGGAVTLGFERIDARALAAIPRQGLFARPLDPARAEGDMPLAIRRALKAARGEGVAALRFAGGWLAEPVAPPRRALWVWGAGHVGRAVVATLAPLPDFAITWIDTAPARFPARIPEGVRVRAAADPRPLVAEAPPEAEHLILTYSHALDLDLCHALLRHGFAGCGLIGSASKWARFRSRLRALGHADAAIARIRCPIGDPSWGKHPQAIAISVAASFLAKAAGTQAAAAPTPQTLGRETHR